MSQTSDLDATCEAVQVRLELGEALSDDLLAHLKACSDCRHARDVSRAFHGALGQGPDWTPGERVLDQYELLEEIGRGGQGAVFKARDLETGLIVALKVVSLDAHSVSEVLHAAGITHPNVCRINYTRACGPFRVIVMEYVRGGTLRERLAQGPIPEPQALAIFRGICEGVVAAHQRDVLHLDLKPGNILLRDGIVPVVSDFGLASVSGSAARGGTTGYMAPEQERGEPVDQRTDVFALGAILADLAPNPTQRLRAAIERARSPTISDRVATVGGLLAEVDEAQRKRVPVAVLALAVGVLLIGSAFGWRYMRPTYPVATAEPGAGSAATPAGPSTASPVILTAPAASAATSSASPAGSPGVMSPATSVTAPTASVGAGMPAVGAKSEACHPSDIDECKRLCNLDDAASCYNAGRYVLQNLANATGAAAYFQRSCDVGYASGCTDLGFMYERGRGVGQDIARAASLYQRACDHGAAHACSNLGGLYGNGNGVGQDLPRAASLFSRACNGGDPQGCGNLGVAYRDEVGVAADRARARDLLKRACRADADWCDEYQGVKGE